MRKITINPVFDVETWELIAHDGQYDYVGPVAEAKGSGYAQTNMQNANNLSGALSSQGLGINSSLVPTLQSEVNNPIGFGQQALTQMQTAGGQTAAAGQAAGQQRAALAASRTGNLASLPAVQDQLARSATQSADQNALGLDIQNNQAKLQQQQQGLRGLQGMGESDIGQSENALGLSNQALNSYMNAANWWEQPLNAAVGGAAKGAGMALA